MLADVGIRTRALSRGTQAVATGETSLDCRRVAPVTVAGHGDASASIGQLSELGLGKLEGPFVLGAHRSVEEPAITKAHLRRDVTEEGHEGLQRHPGIHHGGGEGMSELMRFDVADAGRLAGPIEFEAQSLLGQPSSVVGKEELRGSACARVRERPTLRPGGADPVDQSDSLIVEGHHPLGVEFAERNFEPRPIAGDLVHAVEFEVEELADAQPAGSSQEQRVGRQPEIGASQGLAETPIGVDGQVARKRPGQTRGVCAEYEAPLWCVFPSPLGDVVEEDRNGQDPPGLISGRDRLAVLGVDRTGHRVQVGLDVALSVEVSERSEIWVVVSEETAEVNQARRHAGHGLGLTRPGLALQIGHECRLKSGVDVHDASVERLGLLPVRRRSVKDAQMEQHPVGATEGALVVAPPLASLEATASTSSGQLIEVVEGQLLEATLVSMSRRPTDWEAMRRLWVEVNPIASAPWQKRSMSAASGLATTSRQKLESLRETR